MQTPKKFCLFTPFLLCLFTVCLLGVQGSAHQHASQKQVHFQNGVKPSKLFVFGDSYVDTGNTPKSSNFAWKFPYGITNPGHPAGRMSNGIILSDFIAKFLGIMSPVPYVSRKEKARNIAYGMNFAMGGSGVFHAVVEPNMTTQIDFFQSLIKTESVYKPGDLQHSLALVALAGNDYGVYIKGNGSVQDLPKFIGEVVNQLKLNLGRIQGLGVRKVAVTALPPLGCLPIVTTKVSYRSCVDSVNLAVNLHNSLLKQAVKELNDKNKKSTIFILDLYNSFLPVLEGNGQGGSKFREPLKPCCIATSNEYSCGSVDNKGEKKYTLCQDPESSFFFDHVHPTQAGWTVVYSTLQKTLQQELSRINLSSSP